MHRRCNSSALIAAVLFLALTTAPPAAAGGAPEYVSSEPEDGAKLHEPPDEVSVTFSEPLDPTSRLLVLDECGKRVDNRDVEIFANEMTVGLERGPAGRYSVKYLARGIAGVTGTTVGKFSFVVHMGKSCSGSVGQHHGGMNHGGTKPGRRHGGHASGGHNERAGHETHAGATTGPAHSPSGHAGHPSATGMQDRHGNRDHAQHQSGQHRRHQKRPGAPDPPLAAGPDVPVTPSEDTAQAALAGLVLVLAIGALGGWIVRTAA